MGRLRAGTIETLVQIRKPRSSGRFSTPPTRTWTWRRTGQLPAQTAGIMAKYSSPSTADCVRNTCTYEAAVMLRRMAVVPRRADAKFSYTAQRLMTGGSRCLGSDERSLNDSHARNMSIPVCLCMPVILSYKIDRLLTFDIDKFAM